MKPESLKFDPFRGEETSSAYQVVMMDVVERIYKSLFSLKNDLLHKSFKHQHPILGQLMALYKLHEGASNRIILGLEQVNQWEEIFEEWYKKRKFRSQNAQDYRDTYLKICAALREFAQDYPSDFWPGVPEEYKNGIPLVEKEPEKGKSEKEIPKPEIFEYEKGKYSLTCSTTIDGCHLKNMIVYLASEDGCPFLDEIHFDPESSMFSASSEVRSHLEYIESLIQKLQDDEDLMGIVMKKTDTD